MNIIPDVLYGHVRPYMQDNWHMLDLTCKQFANDFSREHPIPYIALPNTVKKFNRRVAEIENRGYKITRKTNIKITRDSNKPTVTSTMLASMGIVTFSNEWHIIWRPETEIPIMLLSGVQTYPGREIPNNLIIHKMYFNSAIVEPRMCNSITGMLTEKDDTFVNTSTLSVSFTNPFDSQYIGEAFYWVKRCKVNELIMTGKDISNDISLYRLHAECKKKGTKLTIIISNNFHLVNLIPSIVAAKSLGILASVTILDEDVAMLHKGKLRYENANWFAPLHKTLYGFAVSDSLSFTNRTLYSSLYYNILYMFTRYSGATNTPLEAIAIIMNTKLYYMRESISLQDILPVYLKAIMSADPDLLSYCVPNFASMLAVVVRPIPLLDKLCTVAMNKINNPYVAKGQLYIIPYYKVTISRAYANMLHNLLHQYCSDLAYMVVHKNGDRYSYLLQATYIVKDLLGEKIVHREELERYILVYASRQYFNATRNAANSTPTERLQLINTRELVANITALAGSNGTAMNPEISGQILRFVSGRAVEFEEFLEKEKQRIQSSAQQSNQPESEQNHYLEPPRKKQKLE